jgi:S1-C subfamily serine protease
VLNCHWKKVMLEKRPSWLLTLATVALASQIAAQPANPQNEEAVARELAREQAMAERERAALEREYALEQSAAERERANLEREHAREQAAAERERAAAERELAIEQANAEREFAVEQAAAQRELQRELAAAREELARAVGDVARVSAEITRPVLRDVERNLRDVQRNLRFMVGSPAVLGLNIDDSDFGVFVTGVTPNGPAAAAGVTVGDTIVSINDVELGPAEGRASPSATLLGQIGNVVPGDDVKLRILRGGDYRDVVVKAGQNQLRIPYMAGVGTGVGDSRWPTAAWMPFRYSGAWNDIELVSLTPALGEYFGVSEGLLVVRAGRASELGFRDGDVIIDLAGRKPQSPEHALRILGTFEPGESLQAAIMRQRRRETLAIRVPTASSESAAYDAADAE